ncbi:MAG: TetR family transcriptional regulator [Myxococcota bacterium]
MNDESPPAEARIRILREAERLFADQGYDGTSVQQVAEAAGVRRPTLIYHFGSKDQLRLEVLEGVLSRWKEELPRILLASQSGPDRFRSILETAFAFFYERPDRARLLTREMLDRPAEMTSLFAEHLKPYMKLVTDRIRDGQREGHTRRDVDPEAYVVHLMHAAVSMAAMGHATKHVLDDPPSAERLQAELIRLGKAALFLDRPNLGDRDG